MTARKNNIKFLRSQVLKATRKGIRSKKLYILLNNINGDSDQITYTVKYIYFLQ